MKRNIVTDGTRNMELEAICVKTQTQLKKYLQRRLRNMGRNVEIGNGYLYSKGSIPIMLTAHMDTVHKDQPSEMIYDNGKLFSPQGIGGDDRCGVYMILAIIKEYDCHVLFCEDEEIGGEGSSKFIKTQTCKDLIGKINYIIELDRKNSNDAVYYNCDNMDFCKFVEDEFWKYGYGTFSDICNICPVLKCAGVNLSCGYYNQHTKEEYIVLSEMEKAIEETKKLIKRSDNNKLFEYVELESYYKYPFYKGMYDINDYDFFDYKGNAENIYEIHYVQNGITQIEEVLAYSEAEAIGWFMINHPNMTYNDIYVNCIK